MNFHSFYQGKTVLVTGHTGFKGAWLTFWLNQLGAKVIGFSLAPNTTPSMFEALKLGELCYSVIGDVRDANALNAVFEDHPPEIVLHLAAQPLVRLSYADPVVTYETNVMGTLKVLEAARQCASVKAFVNVTTDKCYENKEVTRGYREDEPMGGHDMYSSSKGCVEIMSASFRRSFLQGGLPYGLGNARSGNVIGGGDWSTDRLLPDCIRFIEANQCIEIRNPNAVRPWQHVLDPLSGYLLLAQKLYEQGEAFAEGFNFGPNEESVLTVGEVVKKVILAYGRGDFKLHKVDDLHEATLLMLNIEKAADRLQWRPSFNVQEAINASVEWYKAYASTPNDVEALRSFTLKQLTEYQHRLWNTVNNYATL